MIPLSQSLQPVDPVQPAAGYIGGKKNLARRLTAMIAATPHTLYAEPFVGMGGIFLRRRSRPRVEAINDISGDIANFFRVLQEHPAYLQGELRHRIASRSEFDRLKAQRPELLTDLQRAARFLFLQRLAFGGKVDARHFGVGAGNPARFNAVALADALPKIHARLAGVWIEQLPFGEFIRRYDRDGALFYLDPPYWDCEGDYGAGLFERADFARLADQLADIRGRFILSINDTPGARALFGRFHLQEVETVYMLSAGICLEGKRAGELIVSNRPIAANDR